MKGRFKELRAHIGKSQDAFAKDLGLSTNYISLIESGSRNPSARLIKQISEKYSISEEWLRTGNGEMLIPRTRRDEVADLLKKTLSGETTDFQEALISTLAQLSVEQWELLADVAEKLAAECQKKKSQPSNEN